VAWSEPLSLYCERVDASFWAEPVNALTNLAFLVAAGAAYAAWRGSEARDPFGLALIGVTVAIGLGSFAFHTLATRGAALLDVIPIAIFVYG
jgi:CHASE2 domain-containing sensor protein